MCTEGCVSASRVTEFEWIRAPYMKILFVFTGFINKE